MKLIVGLGNPGNEYKKTRHNIGFMVLDTIKENYSETNWNKKFDGIYFSTFLNQEKVIDVDKLFEDAIKKMNEINEVEKPKILSLK